MRKKKLNIPITIILSIMIVITLIPVAYMLIVALTPHADLFVRLLPTRLTFSNFLSVLRDMNRVRTISNSLIVASSTSILTLILGALAGYGFSRYSFKLKKLCIVAIIVTQILPMEVLVLSYFRIVSRLGLYNTLIALIWTHSTISLPFVILMLRSVVDGVPKEIEEAALIDGCSKLSMLIKIIIPICWSGFFAAGIFAFLQSWIEFLYALVLTSDYRAQTATVDISKLVGHYVTPWEQMMAMAICAKTFYKRNDSRWSKTIKINYFINLFCYI